MLLCLSMLQDDTFENCQLASVSRRTAKHPNICMALVDERLARSRDVAKPPGVLVMNYSIGFLLYLDRRPKGKTKYKISSLATSSLTCLMFLCRHTILCRGHW